MKDKNTILMKTDTTNKDVKYCFCLNSSSLYTKKNFTIDECSCIVAKIVKNVFIINNTEKYPNSSSVI